MVILARIFCIALLLTFSVKSFAEDQPPKIPSAIDGWDDFKSPVTTDAKYFLLGGAALTTILYLTRNESGNPLQEDMAESKPLGSSSSLGDVLGKQVPNLLYAGGMVTAGLINNDKMAYRNASGMMYATVYSYLTTSTLKSLVKEERPNGSKANDSFPSAHTASAFAFASYVGCRHSLPWGIAAYTMAVFVGASRLNDNAHYVHDVVAGATIGGAFGLGTCLAENRREQEIETSLSHVTSSWQITPDGKGGVAGVISLSY